MKINFDDIYYKIGFYCPLPEEPSLPVIIQTGELKIVLWFYYCQSKKVSENRIDQIVFTDDGENIHMESTELYVLCEENSEEPELDEEAYYEKLKEIYEEFSENEMWALLRKAVPESVFEMYQAALQAYVEKHQKELMN